MYRTVFWTLWEKARVGRFEKMQEKFNKDLEEIKKSQSIMNNAINEIKNTLEGLKEMRTTLETSGTMLNTPTFES